MQDEREWEAKDSGIDEKSNKEWETDGAPIFGSLPLH